VLFWVLSAVVIGLTVAAAWRIDRARRWQNVAADLLWLLRS